MAQARTDCLEIFFDHTLITPSASVGFIMGKRSAYSRAPSATWIENPARLCSQALLAQVLDGDNSKPMIAACDPTPAFRVG